jgi:hypothetical protein
VPVIAMAEVKGVLRVRRRETKETVSQGEAA